MTGQWVISFSPVCELRIRVTHDVLVVGMWSGEQGQWQQEGQPLVVPLSLIPGLLRSFKEIRGAVKERT